MAYLTGIHSAVPGHELSAEQLIQLLHHDSFGHSPTQLRKIAAVISSMEIASRPAVVDFQQFSRDLDAEKCPCSVSYPSPDNLFRSAPSPFRPSMTDRAAVWESAVKKLALAATRGLLDKTATPFSDVDCVITNTSTGVMLPNLSTWLPQHVPLPAVTCNFSLDNTGCGGGITCLDMARSLVLAGRARVVVVVTVDVTSVHMNAVPGGDMSGTLPNLLFGDGAAAVLVTGLEEEGSWRMEEPECRLLGENTADFIRLQLHESGYHLTLSRDLVKSLENAVRGFWQEILKKVTGSGDPGEVEWVVHPGGKGILEAFSRQDPPLTPNHLRHSLAVMKERGNLVSASLIFVLQRMWEGHERNRAVLVGPGPGVEIKTMVLEKVTLKK